jgi:predicted phosphohydrolase
MKKIVWTTDPHLSETPSARCEAYFRSIEKENPDYVLVGGDIGTAIDIIKHLKRFSQINAKILFVTGNHDYWGSSIEYVNKKINCLIERTDNLFFLNQEKPIGITNTCCVIGNGCWADGRSGDWELHKIKIKDYEQITGLALYNKNYHLRVIQKIAQKATEHILQNLKLAFKKYDHVYLLTHVPPWREAAVNNGKVSDDHWAPHMVCTVAGEAIEEFMKTCKGKLTVLCGHSHGENELDISDNIHVSTGGAIYYEPEINKIFFEKETVKKLF